MNWLDLTIFVFLVIGFIHGILKGAIQEIFAALAIVVGVIAAGKVTDALDSVVANLSHPTAARVFVFVVAFLVVAIVIGLIGKAFSGLAKAAGLRSIDRLIGGIVGACVVAIIVGIVLTLSEKFGLDATLGNRSLLAPYLIRAVTTLAGFLPSAVAEAPGSI